MAMGSLGMEKDGQGWGIAVPENAGHRQGVVNSGGWDHCEVMMDGEDVVSRHE